MRKIKKEILKNINNYNYLYLLYLAKQLGVNSSIIKLSKCFIRRYKKLNKISYLARARVILRRAIRIQLRSVNYGN